ncbi:MAG: tetratricopeptide repeat protein [Betaproteobacteria bacterium]
MPPDERPAAEESPPPPIAKVEADVPAAGVDVKAAGVDVRATGVDCHTVSVDRFLAAAATEFGAGQIDQPLWTRALTLAEGDEATAKPVYLRARATALRVAARNQRAEKTTRGAGPSSGAAARPVRLRPRDRSADDDDDVERPRAGTPGRMRTMLVAGACGFLLVIVGFVTVRAGSDAVRPPGEAAAVSRHSEPAPVAPTSAAPAPGIAASTVSPGAFGEDLAGKVHALKAAGNWNVLVLYAVEWTRKEPGNPGAWKELGSGYLKLRQLDDALDATTRAASLAPDDFQLWQDLGQVNVAMMRPAEALVAYERAAELNARDVDSLVQAGTLNAQLGHLPQARIAFDKALEVSPGDVGARCGAAAVARKEGRAKDAESLTRQLAQGESRCRDLAASDDVVVATSRAPKGKPATPKK